MEQEQKAEISHIDYKDITRLSAMVNPHARMLSRKRTGLRAKDQRRFAQAIKRARYMALMPYVSY